MILMMTDVQVSSFTKFILKALERVNKRRGADYVIHIKFCTNTESIVKINDNEYVANIDINKLKGALGNSQGIITCVFDQVVENIISKIRDLD